MFTKLKNEGYTFTKFFEEYPIYANKENINRANLKPNVINMNLSEYLEQQKSKKIFEVSRSRSRTSNKSNVEGNIEITHKNLSKLAYNINTKYKKTSYLLPGIERNNPNQKKDSKLNVKTKLLAGKGNTLFKKSTINERKVGNSSSYRSVAHGKHDLPINNHNLGSLSTRLSKPNIKDSVTLLKSINSKRKDKLNKDPKPKCQNFDHNDMLNLKTIESSVYASNHMRSSYNSRKSNLDNVEIRNNFINEEPSRNSIGSLKSKLISPKIKCRKSLKILSKADSKCKYLPAIRETYESNKQSFIENTIKFDTNIKRSDSSLSSDEEFMFIYAHNLYTLSFNFHKIYENVNKNIIIAVIDWIFELATELELSRLTTHIGIRLFFTFMGGQSKINVDLLQLDALNCLNIAIKLEEVETVAVKDLICSLEPKFNKEQLIENENKILCSIKQNFSNYNIFTLNQIVQLLWDDFVDENNSHVVKLFDFTPKFRVKGYYNYILYRINCEMLDYSITDTDLLKESPIDLICIILYYSLLKKSIGNHKELLPIVLNFSKYNHLIQCESTFINKLSLYSQLKDVYTSYTVPENNKCRVYEDFILLQTYNCDIFK